MIIGQEPADRPGEAPAVPTRAGLLDRGRRLWQWAQRTRPWRTFSHFTDMGGSVLSAGMSYQALFAVFAGLWVGFGVAGISLRSRPELLQTLVDQINAFVPGLLGEDGVVELGTLLEARSLDWTSFVAGLALLWVALNWFTGTRRAIRIIFGLDVKQYRNAALLKLRDFVLAIAFFAAIIVSAALTVLSSNVTDVMFSWLGWDPESWFLGTLGTLLRYGTMTLFDVIVLVAMHRYLAEVRVPWRKLLSGCLLGGLALLALKVLGTALLGGAGNNPLLASFAVLIGILIWFNFICRVLLLTAAWIATGVDRSFGLPNQA
ncbi:YihY/virulence factor BrkB family protein [Leucobacter weissii]|uniref:YihY/virulence factor BrkB family protein n=1 Tax=Leucobacter weissii TaxID=1983706 RepID=A0A939MK29_9MICO|nr:YhjD/YihY/BrkB family envelope integrity protein [Leucobacter weissii]MBO1901685.1 YihY/virulence factor BrkB family protein [Leucobacter weissii]